MENQKGNLYLIIAIIVGVIAISATGFASWKYFGGGSELEKNGNEIIKPLIEKETEKSETVDKKTDLSSKASATEDWKNYENKKYGYSFKYPKDCFYGPWPAYCEVELKTKQKPLEKLPPECLCYLDAENSDSVFLKNLIGPGPHFEVFHSIYVDRYSPSTGTDIVRWIQENFSYYQNVPDEINMKIDGIPAVKVYTPYSGMAGSYEDIYFIKNGKLFKIGMLDIDNAENRKLYDQILSTFKFTD